MWGTGKDDVWAVGTLGTILHWNGKAWSEQTSPTDATLFGVYGQAAELWAVGEKGVVLVKR